MRSLEEMKENFRKFMKRAKARPYYKTNEIDTILILANETGTTIEDVIRAILLEHERLAKENSELITKMDKIRRSNCLNARENRRVAMELGEVKPAYKDINVYDIIALKEMGYTHAEVASFMDVSVSTITRRLRELRTKEIPESLIPECNLDL